MSHPTVCRRYKAVPVSQIRVRCQLLQDLDRAVAWSDIWRLPFNETKCSTWHFGRSNAKRVYFMRGTELKQVATERDLGVLIDSELKFREQAVSAVSKATQILVVIRRSFQLIDQTTLPLLFKTLVRPHLEYCNGTWGPFNRADQKLVERVQRRATRMVDNVRANAVHRDASTYGSAVPVLQKKTWGHDHSLPDAALRSRSRSCFVLHADDTHLYKRTSVEVEQASSHLTVQTELTRSQSSKRLECPTQPRGLRVDSKPVQSQTRLTLGTPTVHNPISRLLLSTRRELDMTGS